MWTIPELSKLSETDLAREKQRAFEQLNSLKYFSSDNPEPKPYAPGTEVEYLRIQDYISELDSQIRIRLRMKKRSV